MHVKWLAIVHEDGFMNMSLLPSVRWHLKALADSSHASSFGIILMMQQAWKQYSNAFVMNSVE